MDAVGGAATTVAWSSSDSAVATVDPNGLVTAVAQGTVIITVTSTADPTRYDTVTVTVVPFRYGALAGTFVANSNSPTISPFDGNILFIGITDVAGGSITQTVAVTITVPGIGSFVYNFDPALAVGGVIGLILRDFEAGLGPLAAADNAVAQALSRSLKIPVEVVALGRPAFAPQAAVGGDFVFAFPGQTIVRSVDIAQKLAIPVVTNVSLATDRTALTATFNVSPDAAVNYRLVAFGRGPNAHTGSAQVTGSPATVTLSGALEPGELFVVEATAFRELNPDSIFGNPDVIFTPPVSQVDIGLHLHYSE